MFAEKNLFLIAILRLVPIMILGKYQGKPFELLNL
jgi:hypothetical protein